MAINYTKAAATALRLISENGRAVQIRQLNVTPSNPAKPWEGNSDERGTPQSLINATAAFVSPGADLGFKLEDVVTEVDKISQVAIVAASENPAAKLEFYDEVLDDDGTVYRIVTTDLLKPGTTRILYFLMLETITTPT